MQLLKPRDAQRFERDKARTIRSLDRDIRWLLEQEECAERTHLLKFVCRVVAATLIGCQNRFHLRDPDQDQLGSCPECRQIHRVPAVGLVERYFQEVRRKFQEAVESVDESVDQEEAKC